MASPFATGSGSSSGAKSAFGTSLASPSSGGHSIFHNLVTDVLDTAKGLGPGLVQTVEHPIRSLKTAGEYEKAFYSPLVHGKFGTFWANVHTHPLTPLLDAMTLVSGGATLAGEGAKLAEVAGLADKGFANFARRGTEATTMKLPTSVPGLQTELHLSPNIARRAVQKALIGGTTKASAKLGAAPTGVGAVDKVLTHAFKPGSYLDQSALARGDRQLSRIASAHSAGTRGTMIRQAQSIHRLLKKGATQEDVSRLLYDGITKSVLAHALEVNVSDAAKLTRDHEWTYIKGTHPITAPENHTFNGWAKHLEDRKAVPFTLTRDPAKAMERDGKLLLVHKGNLAATQTEAAGGLRALHVLATSPTRFWKYLVLANAPRYFVNNLVGNSVMLMAQHNPHQIVRGIVQAVSDVHGTRAARREAAALGDHLQAEEIRLAGSWYHRWYGGTQIGPISELQNVGSKTKRVTNSLYAVTEKVAYRGTHMVGINAAISELPQFQEMYLALKRQGYGRVKAFRLAADRVSADPALRRSVEKRAADWAGQYNHSTPVENMIRHLVPFYSWDRHALRFAKEQVLGRPGATNVMAQIGAQGDTYTKKSLGNIPDFMKGAIPLPDKMGGVLTAILGGGDPRRKNVLLTSGLNPLSAAAEDLNTGLALVGQQHGTAGEALASQLNPFITGAISEMAGQRLGSGAKVHHRGGILGGVLGESFGQVPVARLIQAAVSPQPNVTKKGKPTLYTHNFEEILRQIAGLNVRDFSPEAAAIYAKKKHGG